MPVADAYRNGQEYDTISIKVRIMAQQQARASEIQHRRETRRWLLLPMILLALFILAGVVLVVLLARGAQGGAQVSIVADLLLSVLMLCPLVLCMLPVTILLIGAVFGMNRVHSAAASPLRRLEDLSETLTQRTRSASATINQKTLDTSARLGFVYRLLGTFGEASNEEDSQSHGH